MKNSERDGNTRPSDLPPEKSICRSGSNSRTGHGTTDWFQIGKGDMQIDDTIHMAESEEELKCLLMKMKEESEKLA